MISGDLPNGPERPSVVVRAVLVKKMSGGATISLDHKRIEAGLVENHQLFRLTDVQYKVIQERRMAFFTPFSDDQRFFYG